MIKELLIILVSSSLISNVVLSQFLGLCPFLGVSKKTNTGRSRHQPALEAQLSSLLPCPPR